jgi:putative transposase
MTAQTPAEITPSMYYAAKSRPESARAGLDRVLVEKIEQVHEDNYGVYGARKVWAELNRRGVDVARCTVERLTREIGLRGLLRDKGPRTTRPAPETARPADLVKHGFTTTRVNEIWAADVTYVRTAAGWVYAASVLDDWCNNRHGELGHIPPHRGRSTTRDHTPGHRSPETS